MSDNQDLGFDFLDEDMIPGLEIEPVLDEAEEIEVEGEDLFEEESSLENEEEQEEEDEQIEDNNKEEKEEEEKEKEEKKPGKAAEKASFKIDANSFFESLKENKLFKLEEGEELTEENIIEGLKKATEENAALQIYDIVTKAQGQSGWRLFEDIFIKGASREYLENHNSELELNNLDLTDEDTQESLYRTYLKEVSQMPEEEIEEQIEFLKEKNKLAVKAEIAKQELIKSRQSRKQEEADKAAAQTALRKEQEQSYINSIEATLIQASKEKEIDGVPLKTEDSRELLPYMIEKKFELSNGMKISEFEKDLLELRKDPKTALKLAKLTKEKLNLTPVENKGASKKASFLFKEIEGDIKKAPKAEEIDIKSILKALG